MQNAFVESMKTIAKSAVERAGFDKTRTGKIVAINSVTNTYSVRVDGIVYNNVKTVNDSIFNVGDTVKVNIPMNNPSQAYITSSVLSDESFGNKIAEATSAIDSIDERIDGIVEIMGKIYQLSISVTYSNRTVGSNTYIDATYTAILIQDGEDVTSSHSASEFNWYLEKTTGKTSVGAGVKNITLSSEQYLYGQSVILEWSYEGEVKLRARVTLFNESAVEQIAKYATEITTGGVFVHRADGIYDVGSNWQSPNAYGVKITESIDIVKGGEIYGSFGGTYISIGNTSASKNENNILIDSTTNTIQLRKGDTTLASFGADAINLGQEGANKSRISITPNTMFFYDNQNDIAAFMDFAVVFGTDRHLLISSMTNDYNYSSIELKSLGEIDGNSSVVMTAMSGSSSNTKDCSVNLLYDSFLVGVSIGNGLESYFHLQKDSCSFHCYNSGTDKYFSVNKYGDIDYSGTAISLPTSYQATNLSINAGAYLGQNVTIATVNSVTKTPVFAGFDITGTNTSFCHVMGAYIYNDNGTYKGYVKMRNTGSTNITNMTVTVYVAWI